MKIPFRVWILIAALVFSVISIAPNPNADGIVINQVEPSSQAYNLGMRNNQKLLSINDIEIKTISDVTDSLSYLEHQPTEVKINTEVDDIIITVINEIDLLLDFDLTILDSGYPELRSGIKITGVEGAKVSSKEEFNNEVNKLLPTKSLNIKTDGATIAYMARGQPGFNVKKAQTSNIKKGLDLEGGTRVLVRVSGDNIESSSIEDLIAVLRNRLDLYGLSDLNIRSANDLEGSKFILIEIAGLSKRDVQEILEAQGKFEAKIGDELVFTGGRPDIENVCRDDGTCSGVHSCTTTNAGHQCVFQFSIRIGKDAAQRHSVITSKLETEVTDVGSEILSKQIDFYLDNRLVSSLNIDKSLKGSTTQDISISGPGFGESRQAAQADAEQEMQQLQTVLITGSIPLDITTEKLDTISPLLGQEFLKNAIIVGVAAILAVLAVIYIRYRKLKIVIPIAITIISEVVITLGFASLFKWNLDLAAIAGIVAAVGTGVDDQIVIIDEVLSGAAQGIGWTLKIKQAFYIILTAFVTNFAAMLPLLWVGAGLIRGFAFTTLIGITVGVVITRPAYAAIIQKLLKE